ncbi:MAG: type II toxin-antitoxin system mRNA interferase toxin, RelE/StbE family [Patescibacteria group bacterium]
MEILYSSHFERSLKKLPQSLKAEVGQQELIFRKNCFNPQLKTHKLKGRYKDLWSFSITHKHRIVFKFLNKNTVYFIDTGDHSIYQ